ncbi:hypothetical protein U1Q18_044270, partial [Sarracenia purpurea var. burkii]
NTRHGTTSTSSVNASTPLSTLLQSSHVVPSTSLATQTTNASVPPSALIDFVFDSNMPASVPQTTNANTRAPPQDISSTSVPAALLPAFTHNHLVTHIPDLHASIPIASSSSVPSSTFQTKALSFVPLPLLKSPLKKEYV